MSLTIEQRVGQLFFIGLPGPEMDGPTVDLLDRVPPGGVCLFARNIRERRQTRELLDSLRDSLPALPLLSVDQEGGRVDRLRRIMTPMPAANRIRSVEEASEHARIIAESLTVLGFNMDFAPVVDVIDAERAHSDNGLLTRGFGQSADDVVTFAGAFLESLQANGIVGCLKHFPGLGASTVDSHEFLPSVEIDDETLRNSELAPYSRLRDVQAVMVGHAAYPRTSLQETDESGKLLPASLSKTIVTGLLRTDLDFNGLVITDDLEMGAIVRNFGIGEACVMAIEAGCDMLAICAEPDAIKEGFSSVLAAVEGGRIGVDRIDASVERIDQLRMSIPSPPDFDGRRLDELCEAIRVLDHKLGN